MSAIRTSMIILILSLLHIAIVPQPLRATELTLERCIEEALRSNPRITLAESERDAAREKSAYATLLRYPEISTQFSYFRLSDVPAFSVTTPFGSLTLSEPVLDVYNAQLSVTQPLFTGFRISGQIKASILNAQAAGLSVSAEQSSLIMDVTEAYYQLVLAAQRRDVIEERIGSLNLHFDNVRHFFDAGIVTRNDVLQTEVALSNGLIQLNQAESAIIKARVRLAVLLGRDRGDDIDVPAIVPDAETVTPDNEGMVERALQQRFEPASIQRRIQATEEMQRVTRSVLFPSLYAMGTYSVANPNTRYQPVDDQFEDDWSVGIMLRFIPFDWGRTNRQLGEVEATKRQLAARLELVRQSISAQVTTIYESLREMDQRKSLIDRKVLQAEEGLRVARELYAAGVTTNSDVLDAETNLLFVQLDRTHVRIEYIITKAMLEFATADNVLALNSPEAR